MKSSFIALASLAIILAGCSGEPATPGGGVEMAAGTTGLIADLGGISRGPVHTKKKGGTLALSGFDAVSYFSGAAPVRGSGDYRVRYQGFDYQFANAANAAIFQDNPLKYAPQYGGYCAWAIAANDALAPGDPQIYKIVEGKLYLKFSEDGARRWQADIPGFIVKGNRNYLLHDAGEHYTS